MKYVVQQRFNVFKEKYEEIQGLYDKLRKMRYPNTDYKLMLVDIEFKAKELGLRYPSVWLDSTMHQVIASHLNGKIHFRKRWVQCRYSKDVQVESNHVVYKLEEKKYLVELNSLEAQEFYIKTHVGDIFHNFLDWSHPYDSKSCCQK